MGCGASTMGAEDGSLNCHSNLRRRQRAVRPLTDNTLNGGSEDENIIDTAEKQEAECAIGNGTKEQHKKNEEKEEESDHDREYMFFGPGSPSFREYCIDYDSAETGYSNDSDSEESTKIEGKDDSTERKSKPQRKGIINPNKEPPRKDGKRRRLRNVLSRRRSGGKKTNLASYSSAHKSFAADSGRNRAGKVA